MKKQDASKQTGPEMDVKSGKMINPHNPEFITKRPWYLGESGPSLTHHVSKRAKDHVISMSEADALVAEAREKRNSTSEEGAAVHVGMWVEVLYRGKSPWVPAKVEKVRLDGTLDASLENGRRATRVPRAHLRAPKSSAASLEGLGKVSYDAKRDRWHGYDPSMHRETVERFAEMDAARAKTREQKRDDEFELREDQQQDFQRRIARQGGLGGAQMKTTVRNLRIREDTAKYLRNLDPDSAFYDPKSRAMRENPTPNVDPKDLVYAGDNFARATGDALELAATQVFAWDVADDVAHVQAEPSRLHLMRKETLAAEKKNDPRIAAIKDKYGDASTRDDDHPEVRGAGAQSEAYREYAANGTLVAGAPLAVPTSKYPEDVFVNNHTAVWGSYFCTATFRWGYADDHSLVKNSYSIGPKGRRANDAAAHRQEPTRRPAPHDTAPKPVPRSALFGLPDSEHLDLDEAKVAEAISKQEEQQRDEGSSNKKRGYNSLASTEVTIEEMEAYRRSKVAAADPMAKFLRRKDLPAPSSS
ncbi:hypothetical protein CTAYLR_009364 [Chrysophaeum taylorii]|uniref:Pre-mRNA-splicing factor SLU7 n=1 Tax=Chrysophaeum taylorii TaxID=2483200 RepID=A0AAD7UJ23_9STRA|nr:hypothetical protein CTAYLR_009364 [Chrysophaeum taylorii]